MLGLEVSDILSNPLQVRSLVLTGDQVIGSIFLVGSDKVRVVDRGQGFTHVFHQGEKLPLQVVVENLSSGHGLVEGHGRDIPTTENEVIGMNHGQDIRKGNVDVFAGFGIESESQSGRSDQGPNVVGLNRSGLGGPRNVVSVGEDGGADGGTVVAADADHHQSDLGNLGVGLEFKGLGDLLDGKSTTFDL
jgi:hypothetical protein